MDRSPDYSRPGWDPKEQYLSFKNYHQELARTTIPRNPPDREGMIPSKRENRFDNIDLYDWLYPQDTDDINADHMDITCEIISIFIDAGYVKLDDSVVYSNTSYSIRWAEFIYFIL